MIKALSDLVIILLKRISIDTLLKEDVYSSNLDAERLEGVIIPYMKNYSDTEIRHLLAGMEEFLRQDNHHISKNRNNKVKLDIFNAIFRLAEAMLVEQDNEILCKYSGLLRWRRLVMQVSEETFVAAFIAQKDVKAGTNRKRFTYKTVVSHNNVQLKAILSEGMSENHFHLLGSAPYFHLSWIQLMNFVNDKVILQRMRELEKRRRNVNVMYNESYRELSLEDRIRQAFLIRFYLSSKLIGMRLKFADYHVDVKYSHFDFGGFKDALKYKIDCNALKEFWQEKQLTIFDIIEEVWDDITCQRFYSNFRELHELMRQLDGIYAKMPTDIKRDGSSVTIIHLLEYFLKYSENVSLAVCEPFMDKSQFEHLWQEKTLEYVKYLLCNPDMLQLDVTDIQHMIYAMKGANRFLDRDYAFLLSNYEWNEDQVQYVELWGERNFLYQCFYRICKEGCLFSAYESNLFHAYLNVKENIRSELIQANEYVGFENFQIIQDRKDYFLPDRQFIKDMARMAVSDTIKTQPIISLEARIKPAKSAKSNCELIRFYDNAIDCNKEIRDRFFYVFHFIKSKEQDSETRSKLQCRSYGKRRDNAKYANAIVRFRELYPQTASRVLGIDAASQEIGCRPEVFAPVFRMLKAHTHAYGIESAKKLVPQLRVSYHVGEDFLDITDGMRAISEAILFLGLDCGDRLGHALALGINVEEWYASKNFHLSVPMHDYLDNVVWLYHMLEQYDIPDSDSFRSLLLSEFSTTFKKIYGSSINQKTMEGILAKVKNKYGSVKGIDSEYYLYNVDQITFDFDIHTYYNAWKLRGDEPELYKEGFFDKRGGNGLGYITHEVNQDFPLDYKLRYVPEVAYLYYLYHYSPDVKKIGKRDFDYVVTPQIAKIITLIQKALQKEIAQRGIGIETNPSSNYMIGTFKYYAKHPIVNFYNYGLVADGEKVNTCPQISCSINTDDQGVFSASLENEYALMARALEKEVDADGNKIYNKTMIYEWIDNIRKNGNRQSFKSALNISTNNFGADVF